MSSQEAKSLGLTCSSSPVIFACLLDLVQQALFSVFKLFSPESNLYDKLQKPATEEQTDPVTVITHENLKRKTPKQEFFFNLARLRAHPLIQFPSGALYVKLLCRDTACLRGVFFVADTTPAG